MAFGCGRGVGRHDREQLPGMDVEDLFTMVLAVAKASFRYDVAPIGRPRLVEPGSCHLTLWSPFDIGLGTRPAPLAK